MERQAAYDLLKCFLEKRKVTDIDLKKELPGLLAYGVAQGCFGDPNTVFCVEEWRRLGDVMWEKIIDEDKVAKKLARSWRAVTNCLAQHQAEQSVAQKARTMLNGQGSGDNGTSKTTFSGEEPSKPEGMIQLGKNSVPLPPRTANVLLPAPSSSAVPSAPPLPRSDPSPRNSASNPFLDSFVEETIDPLSLGEEERLEGEATAYHHEDVTLSATATPPQKPQPAPRLTRSRASMWQSIHREAVLAGDMQAAEILHETVAQAFPVTYTQRQTTQGVVTEGVVTALDWKILTQLRATVNESGIHSEPAKQLLNYIWGANVLLQNDIRTIMKMILTQSQQLLWQAHWQDLCIASANAQRGQGHPLHGVTVEELMGTGPFSNPDHQALRGPDKLREAMRLALEALGRVKIAVGMPTYMNIKQGREESFAQFVDKVSAAIDQTPDVQEWMKGALLRQCLLQNCNPATRTILASLPGNASIEEMLERMSRVPVGPQAMLVEAVKESVEAVKQLGEALRGGQEQQTQALAALAPLRAVAATRAGSASAKRITCFRCGKPGHMRRECTQVSVWCPACQTDTHAAAACRRNQGNGRRSAQGRRATTPRAALATGAVNPSALPPPFVPTPQDQQAWTWQPQ